MDCLLYLPCSQEVNDLIEYCLNLGISDIQSSKEILKPPPETPVPNVDTESQHTNNTPHSNSNEGFQANVETPSDRFLTPKDEQQYLAPIELPTLAESPSPRPSPVASEDDGFRTEDSVTSDVFERAGSNVSSGSGDRTDSDIVFKTAPNTPVLSKHLTVVSSEVVIDSPDFSDLVVNLSEDSRGPLGANLDFPSADGEESCDTESEPVTEVPEPEEDKNCSMERKICEGMSHNPGELYDIAEEISEEEEEEVQSEDQEEEEEEDNEDEDDDDDEEDSGNVTQPTIEEEYPEEIVKKNFVNQETQIQEKVGDLAARLCARELESNKLLCQIDELQHDVMVKSGGMDRLQAELNAAHKESEFVRKRLRKLEEDLDSFKQKNTELTEELQKRSGEMNESDGFDWNHLLELEEQVKDLTARVKDLESQLETVRVERDRLEKEARELEVEREEERRIVQEALDEATAEKEAIQERFEKDFEKLRTVNTDREQQLLDDFEWKLREVEQACKRRLDEKEKFAKQRIKAAEDKLKAVEEDLAQLERLKQFEAEASQLRGLNLEQQRALRFAERSREQLQVSEKVLQEEVKKLKELLDKEKAALTTMQAIHNREIDEKDRKMKFRLEQQKTDLNSQWEEKLKKETIRLKVELDEINRREKRLTLEAARVEKEGELLKAKEKWEKKFQDLIKEIDVLKQKMEDKEEEHKKNIDTIRTNADRDIFELRRKLDRIDLSYQEKIDRIQNDHEREKERLTEEAERKLQGCEQNWQLQLGSTRTTLELVKEQLKREAADQLQTLHDNHRRQLEEQWEQLTQERDEAIAALEARHRSNSEKMRAELDTVHKCRNSREQELVEMVTKMRHEICGKTILIGDLSNQAESLKNNIQDLNQQIIGHDQKFQQTKEENEKKLRLMEDCHKQACAELAASHRQETDRWRVSAEQLQARVSELTKQIEESKDSKLVEDLRKALSDKEHQVAQLSKEKHLYQLELMNRNCHSETVTARQRRKNGRGKPNTKPGPSRAQQK
ncbi:protein FAM184A isoform X5 [Homalodisca vitripennis]|uniref:protein FAM184A isoform X5 n=1 Tax=Homalodisca vitripennis TaxID=197043 RepID=UPI001EEB2CAC|nr:protein FAM184A isoform X5 [Homalodisca vitripennis]